MFQVYQSIVIIVVIKFYIYLVYYNNEDIYNFIIVVNGTIIFHIINLKWMYIILKKKIKDT